MVNEKYVIVGKIGKGSFGEVYACVYPNEGNKHFLRAIKTVFSMVFEGRRKEQNSTAD